jgi:hypothetical protein
MMERFGLIGRHILRRLILLLLIFIGADNLLERRDGIIDDPANEGMIGHFLQGHPLGLIANKTPSNEVLEVL